MTTLTLALDPEETVIVAQYRLLSAERQRKIERFVAALREEERKADEAEERRDRRRA